MGFVSFSVSSQDAGAAAAGSVPFRDAGEAWFWFVSAQQARLDGARVVSGRGRLPRPCEPLDILRVLDRLYRQRRLVTDHLLVLRHYGLRHLAPDARRPRERRAAVLWGEAMTALEHALRAKGIVAAEPWWRVTPVQEGRKDQNHVN